MLQYIWYWFRVDMCRPKWRFQSPPNYIIATGEKRRSFSMSQSFYRSFTFTILPAIQNFWHYSLKSCQWEFSWTRFEHYHFQNDESRLKFVGKQTKVMLKFPAKIYACKDIRWQVWFLNFFCKPHYDQSIIGKFIRFWQDDF